MVGARLAVGDRPAGARSGRRGRGPAAAATTPSRAGRKKSASAATTRAPARMASRGGARQAGSRPDRRVGLVPPGVLPGRSDDRLAFPLPLPIATGGRRRAHGRPARAAARRQVIRCWPVGGRAAGDQAGQLGVGTRPPCSRRMAAAGRRRAGHRTRRPIGRPRCPPGRGSRRRGRPGIPEYPARRRIRIVPRRPRSIPRRPWPRGAARPSRVADCAGWAARPGDPEVVRLRRSRSDGDPRRARGSRGSGASSGSPLASGWAVSAARGRSPPSPRACAASRRAQSWNVGQTGKALDRQYASWCAKARGDGTSSA